MTGIRNEKKWYLIDAKEQTLGRISNLIVNIISGRHRPDYLPYLNDGDYIIVINVESIVVSGNKSTQKIYRRHSGRPGGLKIERFEKLQLRIPEKILENAVKNMLPKNSLGRDLFKNLKIYKSENHPHICQNPERLILE